MRQFYQSSDPLPGTKRINGRFLSPWCNLTEKRSTKCAHLLLYHDKTYHLRWYDVLKYITTSKQRKLKISVDESTHQFEALEKLQSKVDMTKINSTNKSHLTWIGHATTYYQTDGVYFLTDPVWSKRASPSTFFGPARYSII